MQQRIRRFNVMSVAMTMGALYFFLGIIIAICAWLFLGAIRGMMGNMSGASGGGMMGGAMGIIIAPILYGIIGVVFGAIAAFFYNIVAGWTGGVGMELE